MDTRRIDWEQEKEFSSEHLRAIEWNKYKKLLTSGRWYTNDPKYAHIIALVGLYQNIIDESNNTPEKSNRYKTKREAAYTRYLPPWIIEYIKGGGWEKRTMTGNNIGDSRNTKLAKASGSTKI